MEDRFKTIDNLKENIQESFIGWLDAGFPLQDNLGLKQAIADNNKVGLDTLVEMCINYGKSLNTQTILTEN
jgi:hypothetical protein